MKKLVQNLLILWIILLAGTSQLSAHTGASAADSSSKKPVSVAPDPGCGDWFIFISGSADEEKHIFRIKETFIENEGSESEEDDEFSSSKKRVQSQQFILVYAVQNLAPLFRSKQISPNDFHSVCFSAVDRYLLLSVFRL